jgi:hypothetical protein
MEFLPSELLINIIDNIWNLDTLIQLQQTNKILYDCVNSSYSFTKLKKYYNYEKFNKWQFISIICYYEDSWIL